MEKKAETAKDGRVASNGNGNGYKNGNGNGNGNASSAIGVANLISTGVLLLAIFGMWWSVADPRARLDKLETNIVDTRKELNEGLNNIRKEIPERYVTQREHVDLQNRLMSEIEVAHKTHDSFLPKVQFEAWKTEHDVYIAEIVKRIDNLRGDLHEIQSRFVPREEFIAMQTVLKDRIDQLYALYRETQGKK